MKDTAESIRTDFKTWRDKYINSDVKVGWSCISLLFILLRAQLAVLDRIEKQEVVK